MSPAKRRQVVEQVRAAFHVSERRACRALQQPRSTQHYRMRSGDAARPLTRRMVALATRHGRYGYRRNTALLRQEGWGVLAENLIPSGISSEHINVLQD